MLDPNEIIKLSEESEKIASELQEDIVKEICERIAIRLARGDDYLLTPRDKWQLEVLKDAGYLVDDLAKIVAKHSKRTVKEMRKAFAEAGVSSTKFDDITYINAGIPVSSIQQSPAMIRLLERGMNKTYSSWKNFTGTTLQQSAEQFIRECDKAYNAVLSGSIGYGEAAKRALQNIVTEDGNVRYSSGHRDTLEVATYRAVRTGISQACSDITSVRAAENGITLFITSSHLGARPTHEPWQGKVFWVDWDLLSAALGITYENPNTASISEKAKYDEFVKTTEIGTVTGLCGANCRHSYGPYIEGISHNPYTQFDSEENRKRYEAEQTQRSFERRIRKQRRKVEGLKAGLKEMDPGVAKETRDQLKKEQAKLNDLQRQYKEYSEDQGLKVQTNRLEIAKATSDSEEYNNYLRSTQFETTPTADELLAGANKYGNNNCTNAVPAYELRCRGNDVTAAPRNSQSELLKDPTAVWVDPDVRKPEPGNELKDITDSLRMYGNDSRVEIAIRYDHTHPAVIEEIKRRNGALPGRHLFIGRNDDGIIRFVDPTGNEADASYMFEILKKGETEYWRIDDRKFNEKIIQCFEVEK